MKLETKFFLTALFFSLQVGVNGIVIAQTQSKFSEIFVSAEGCRADFVPNPRKGGNVEVVAIKAKQLLPGENSQGCEADLTDLSAKVDLARCSLVAVSHQKSTIGSGQWAGCNLHITPYSGNPRIEWEKATICRYICLK